MNMKKIMAGVVASVMAVSTMSVASFAEDEVDTSSWQISLVTMDTDWQADWSGGIQSDSGVLTLTAKVSDVMEKSATATGKLAAVNIQVWNVPIDCVVEYTITIGDAVSEVNKKAKGEDNNYGGSYVVKQYNTADYDIAEDDTISVTISLPAAEGDTTTAGGNGATDGKDEGDKNTPNSGIEGVAVVAGLAIVAAGAVVVAKKRK